MFTSLQEMADSLRNLMATAKATTDSANESTLQLGHVGAAPEAPEAPPEAGGDGDSTGSLVLTTSSPPESAAFSDSSTPPPVASEVCPSPPSEEDPSAFEEAKMAAFFGPDVQPVASFGGDDEAQTPPAPQGNPFPVVRTAARPPFDIDAGGTPFDAVAFTSAANFYGDSRVR